MVGIQIPKNRYRFSMSNAPKRILQYGQQKNNIFMMGNKKKQKITTWKYKHNNEVFLKAGYFKKSHIGDKFWSVYLDKKRYKKNYLVIR